MNRDLVGKQYPEGVHEVTAEWIQAFARASNDDNPRYRGDDIVAPPLWHAAPGFPHSYQVSSDPNLGVDYSRVVHVEQEHVVHDVTRPGDKLVISSTLAAVDSGPEGSSYTVVAPVRRLDGATVAEMRAKMFVLGTGPGYKPVWSRPDEPPSYEETTLVDEDQPRRWAEVTGDDNPIHLDRTAARKAGLRGIVLHGMCTMTLASTAAVNGPAGGDPTRVRRTAVRFSWPVIPGEEITTKLWALGSDDALTTFGFETYNSKGKAVITDGRVEIGPPRSRGS